jgi:hypothetical protein
MYWECRQKQRSESYDFLDEWAFRISKKALGKRLTETGTYNPKDRQTWSGLSMNNWGELLLLYTPCLLTHPTDKLMAIKGIITNIETGSFRTCLLGFWTDKLPTGLLRCVSEPEFVPYDTPKSRGRLANGLPSWTWASIHS